MGVTLALEGLVVVLVGVVGAGLFDASSVRLDASSEARSCL